MEKEHSWHVSKSDGASAAQAPFWLDGVQGLIILHNASNGVSKAKTMQPQPSNYKDLGTVPKYPSYLTGLKLRSLSEIDFHLVDFLSGRSNTSAKSGAGVKGVFEDLVCEVKSALS